MKRCGKCHRILPLSDFPKNKRRKDGRSNRCKECMADTHRLRTYGITEDQYIEMYNSLEGECPLCSRWYKDLVVDHDHKTGTVRGLLCLSCNRALAYIEDTSWLEKAKLYLRITK